MSIERGQIEVAVRKVLDEGVWPVYETQDDNGLEEKEYVDFVLEVLAKIGPEYR